jgi:hypothetical protein
MKQIIAVNSNPFYTQVENETGDFTLKATLELVIVYADGKDYEIKKGGFVAKNKLSETRLLVSPDMIQQLITDLQLHQKTIEGIRKNADQINSMIKYVQGDKTK